MKLNEIQRKLYDKLADSGWGDKLKMFLLSDEFGQILKQLYARVQDEKRFTPVLKDMFSAFEKCPYSKLKVIMLASSPYPEAGVADGMAFSCSNSSKIQPALRVMFQDLETQLFPEGMTWDTDLTRWANQGVLLLNTSLTTDIGTGESHEEIWQPFMTALFDMLSTYNTGLVYVFMGQKAKEWHTSIPLNNYKFFTTHPTSAVYTPYGKWDSGNLFKNIDRVLEQNYGETIQWEKTTTKTNGSEEQES